jgi:hypothetical protein
MFSLCLKEPSVCIPFPLEVLKKCGTKEFHWSYFVSLRICFLYVLSQVSIISHEAISNLKVHRVSFLLNPNMSQELFLATVRLSSNDGYHIFYLCYKSASLEIMTKIIWRGFITQWSLEGQFLVEILFKLINSRSRQN